MANYSQAGDGYCLLGVVTDESRVLDEAVVVTGGGGGEDVLVISLEALSKKINTNIRGSTGLISMANPILNEQ